MAVLTEDKKQFQLEQDKLLETILNYRFFYPWKGYERKQGDMALQNDSNLEIYITAACNQNCSYCYLKKYPDLYPQEISSPDQILNNLIMLYDYIMINNFRIPIMDMFSGEIWHTKLGEDILGLTLEYIRKGMQIGIIEIASNCYFVNDDETMQKMQQFINKFNELGHPLLISISVDGAFIDNQIRPRENNTLYTDEFYDRLFSFAKINGFLFHPMISADNVKYWKENYKWWKEKINYYNLGVPLHRALMLLEVRNDNWTKEAIDEYCELLRFFMDDFLASACNGSIEIFGDSITGIRSAISNPTVHGYIPWAISNVDTFMGCTVSSYLSVRLGDLAICPCHRTAYDSYLYGYFNVENNHITGVRAQNVQMAIRILMNNLLTTSPLCTDCIYNKICLHGCYGAQLEYMKDPFFPIYSVCQLFKAKYHTIFEYLREKGVIEYLKGVSAQEINSILLLNLLKTENEDKEVNKNGLGTCR